MMMNAQSMYMYIIIHAPSPPNPHHITCTYTMPSMVREASAMLVAITHLRAPVSLWSC